MPLPESDLNKIEATLPLVEAEETADGTEVKTVMSPQEALEKLRAGQALENVRVVRLTFKGEFPLPVRLKHVVLVQPHFDGAVFRGEVALHGCTVERANVGRPTEFHQDLSLAGSTLIRVQLNRVTVRGKLHCDNVVCRGRFLLRDSRFEGGTRFWEPSVNVVGGVPKTLWSS
jgi:hypothetical protein